ncbi:hypothetical protein ABTY59_32160 [Streptomyces sp. NPDC096079]|uniref:hypothetical protein n=1 Tax=Streptomyces sp. NPDC096079 TaxID=3155820 RepID=UPI00333150F3
MAPSWDDHLLACIDDDYDREYGDEGGRFAAYVRKNIKDFRDAWSDDEAPHEDPRRFALAAWRVATGPVMAPGYVRLRPDLHGVRLHIDEWDGALYADVTFPLPQHFLKGPRIPYEWRDWENDDFGFGDYRSMVEPRLENAVTPAVLTTTVVRITGRHWELVKPTAYEGPTLVQEARRALNSIVDHINREAGPQVASILNGA